MSIAHVIKIVPYEGGNTLVVSCPFCKKTHSHGEMYVIGKRDFGTRLGHCGGVGRKEYRLVLKE